MGFVTESLEDQHIDMADFPHFLPDFDSISELYDLDENLNLVSGDAEEDFQLLKEIQLKEELNHLNNLNVISDIDVQLVKEFKCEEEESIPLNNLYVISDIDLQLFEEFQLEEEESNSLIDHNYSMSAHREFDTLENLDKDGKRIKQNQTKKELSTSYRDSGIYTPHADKNVKRIKLDQNKKAQKNSINSQTSLSLCVNQHEYDDDKNVKRKKLDQAKKAQKDSINSPFTESRRILASDENIKKQNQSKKARRSRISIPYPVKKSKQSHGLSADYENIKNLKPNQSKKARRSMISNPYPVKISRQSHRLSADYENIKKLKQNQSKKARRSMISNPYPVKKSRQSHGHSADPAENTKRKEKNQAEKSRRNTLSSHCELLQNSMELKASSQTVILQSAQILIQEHMRSVSLLKRLGTLLSNFKGANHQLSDHEKSMEEYYNKYKWVLKVHKEAMNESKQC